MSKIERIQFAKVMRPMKTTFATSLGAKTCATSVIVRVTLDDGNFGIGEVPTSFVFSQETVEAIKKIIVEERPHLIGLPIEEYASFIQKLRKRWPQFHMTVSGLEVALFRAWLASRGKNEFRYWGAKSKTLETDITIPFVPKADMLDNWLAKAIKTDFRIYKIKVSGDIEADIKFVEMIYHRLNNSGKKFVIRLDGNQGYTAASCLTILDKLEKKKIAVELFEQPLKHDDYAGFKQLYKRASVPIIADETVLCPDDCKRVIDDRLAHGVNIKIAKSGIADSQEILKLAKQAKLKLMIGCMTETMVGLSAAIYFAAGTNAFDYIDLDSVHFLHHKNSYDGLTINGRYYNIE
jgi:L-alanine-DL-glutamate epimerase-like enolase superfamily enzyme